MDKSQSGGYEHRRKRSTSRDRQVRRDSMDSVSYDKSGIPGDEVSIHGVEWSGDGVSMGTDKTSKPVQSTFQPSIIFHQTLPIITQRVFFLFDTHNLRFGVLFFLYNFLIYQV